MGLLGVTARSVQNEWCGRHPLPASSWSSARRSCARSVFAPLATSRNTFTAPPTVSVATCAGAVWPSVDTRRLPVGSTPCCRVSDANQEFFRGLLGCLESDRKLKCVISASCDSLRVASTAGNPMTWTEITRAQHDRSGLHYASDVTDEEWAIVGPFLARSTSVGRPAKRIRAGRFGTRFNIWRRLAASGACCPRIFRHIRPCSTISTAGATAG